VGKKGVTLLAPQAATAAAAALYVTGRASVQPIGHFLSPPTTNSHTQPCSTF